AAMSQTVWQLALAQGLVLGLLGSSSEFGPLLSDISQWFVRRRGLAVGIVACGNYMAAVIWPPIVQHFAETAGWRVTYVGIGIVCFATMLPLALMMRRPPPSEAAARGMEQQSMPGWHASPQRQTALSPNVLMAFLIVAGIACCVAMAMPQVHIVALCADLGYGPARGAEMLSVMMAGGVISRLISGWICDRIGGLMTLLAGSILQGIALLMFLPSDALVSLYVVSGLFGLFQGGIVPAYAIIVREYFNVREAGQRIGIVLFATLIGMALGGWMSGRIFDVTGTYYWAFVNGIAWNLLNGSIAGYLLWRLGRPGRGSGGSTIANEPRPATA
ncbi:MAG: MFS transporter, partial [Hyphomicrobiaceae bacterium]